MWCAAMAQCGSRWELDCIIVLVPDVSAAF